MGVALVLAIALVVVAGAWLVSGRPSRDGATREHAGEREAADAGPGGFLAAPGRVKRTGETSAEAAGDSRSTAGPASHPPLKSPGPTWIAGEVVDEAGAPVPWARVGMHAVQRGRTRASDHDVLFDLWIVKADAEGRFWRNLHSPEFEAWLVVTDDRTLMSNPVLATAGRAPVRLVAVRRKTARVRVTDAKERPIDGASVLVRPVRPLAPREWTLDGLHASDWATAAATLDATELRTTTDATGLAVVALPDARVRMALDVEPPIDRDDLLAVHLVPWTPSDEVGVRLPVGLSTTGKVVDSRGRPWLQGVVVWTPDGGAPQLAKIAYDGTFDLPAQPPGPIRLELRNDALLRPREPRSTVVAAGATNVVLVCDTANELALRVANRPKGAGGQAFLSVEGGDGVGRGATRVELENDGTAVLAGLLDDETYVLWIPAVEIEAPPTADGKAAAPARTGYVYRRGVTVRDSPLVVEEVAGEAVELEIAGRGGWYAESASIAERGVAAWANFEFTGAFVAPAGGGLTVRYRATFPSLPPGDWTVIVAGSDADGDEPSAVSLDVTVKAGEKPHVDFGPPDPKPR